MIHFYKSFILCLLFSTASVHLVFSQSVNIKGKVLDIDTYQPIAGATIKLANSALATTTDTNGEFDLKIQAVGEEFGIVTSYVGYKEESTFVKTIGGGTKQVSILLINENSTIDEVVVTRRRVQASELALLEERRLATLTVEKIGAQELSRKGVGDVATAVTKMSGISKEDGSSQVFVRGLGDRYNSTALNGLPIPSNDPEKKNIDLDLFSTDIVEYISVDKVYNASMAGDFAGGNVDIYSKNYSGDGLLAVQIGANINTNSIKQFDDFYLNQGHNLAGFTPYKVPANALTSYDFQNSLNPKKATPLAGDLGLQAGKSYTFNNESRLNLFATGNFSSGYEFQQGINKEVDAQGDNVNDLTYKRFTYKTNTTGLFNANYKIQPDQTIAYNFMFVNSSYQARNVFEGKKRDQADDYNGLLQRGTYVQNKLYVNQLLGNHKINNRIDLNWGASFDVVRSDMPDRTWINLKYDPNVDGYTVIGNASNHRYYQNLIEDEVAVNLAAKYKIGDVDKPTGLFTLGYSGKFKKRNFEAIQFNFTINGNNFSTIVDPNNLDGFFNQANYESDFFNISAFSQNTPQTYNGDQKIHSVFGNLEYNLSEKLTSVLGIRYDKLSQMVSWRTQLDGNGGTNTFSRNEFLPSLNLKYAINEKQNLRFGASKTYTLPQFKERAPFLFEDDDLVVKYGNQFLYPSQDYNLDLKWELFPKASELVSVTLFGKYIVDPINETFVASSSNDISYVNIGDHGTVYGVEFELKKDLVKFNNDNDVLSGGLNFAYMRTNQELDSEKVARETNFTINLTDNTSSFTGASDLLINGDLSYSKNWESGANVMATAVYSYYSDKIYALGSYGKGNLIDKGVGMLDIVLRSKITKKFGINLTAKNILNPEFKRIQANQNGDFPVLTYKRGAFFNLGLNYNF